MSQLPAFSECIQIDKFTEGNANDIMQSFTYKDNAVHFEQIFPWKVSVVLYLRHSQRDKVIASSKEIWALKYMNFEKV